MSEVFVEDDPQSMLRYEATLDDVTARLRLTSPAGIAAYRVAVNRRFEEARHPGAGRAPSISAE